MNIIEILQLSPKKFKRKSWSTGYCYISDIDFCVYIVLGSADDDEPLAFKGDLLANDWEIIEA